MSTLILDIETIGQEWDSLPETSKESLTKWIDKSGDEKEEKDRKRDDVKERLSLSPFTGLIVSVAMYDVERDLGAVYFTSDLPDESFKSNSFTFKQRTEKEILEDFWEGAIGYDTFVTFNGRAFALPFLMHRSVINEIKPSVEIAHQRYLTKQSAPFHVDVLDEMTFYGAVQKDLLYNCCVIVTGPSIIRNWEVVTSPNFLK